MPFRQPIAPLPGRAEPLSTATHHALNGHALQPPFPTNLEEIWFSLGCFWGAERCFWELPGVWVSAVGYAGGLTPNPTYEEVCSGQTGHAESVRVVFDPQEIELLYLLRQFWEQHDPTQGLRQGNDIGSHYRSLIHYHSATQKQQAEMTRDQYQSTLTRTGYGPITTEIVPATTFYYAEGYHQQYLAKNPNGYCGLGGTGIRLPGP